jgi:hypothetical protein
MSTDDRNLFRTLAPPPGGVERFRRRLGDVDAETRPMFGRHFLAPGLLAALIAVIVTFNLPPSGDELPKGSRPAPPVAGSAGRAPTVDESQDAPAVPVKIPELTPPESSGTRELVDLRRAPAFARLLGQSLRPAETRVAIDEMQVAVAELPSTNPKIRIYQVSNN